MSSEQPDFDGFNFSSGNYWLEMSPGGQRPAGTAGDSPFVRLNASGFYGAEYSTGFFSKLAGTMLDPATQMSTAETRHYSLRDLIGVHRARTDISRASLSADGSSTFHLESVVEDVHVLQLLTARRIALRLAITVASDGSTVTFSTKGTTFEGLQIGGVECIPHVVPKLVVPMNRSAGPSDFSSSRSVATRRIPLAGELNTIFQDIRQWPGNTPIPTVHTQPEVASLVDYFIYGGTRHDGFSFTLPTVPENTWIHLGVLYIGDLAPDQQTRTLQLVKKPTQPGTTGTPGSDQQQPQQEVVTKPGSGGGKIISGTGTTVLSGPVAQSPGRGTNPNKA